MKKIQRITLAALATLLVVSSAQAALIRFVWDGAGDGVTFTDPGNWGGEASDGTNIPGDVVDAGDTSNVIMQSGGASTSITGPFTPANPFDILIVRSGHALDVSGDFNLAGIPTLVGQTGTGSVVNHSSGIFSMANLTLGSAVGSGAYNLSGNGNLSAAAMNVVSNSTLSVSGSSITLSAVSLSLDTQSILDFAFGPLGISTVSFTGGFNITPGAMLNVNGSGYSGGAGSFDLVAFGSNSGTFADPADININGFTGFNTDIGYDGDSMFLNLTAIPEASSSILFVLGGVLLFVRRRIIRL